MKKVILIIVVTIVSSLYVSAQSNEISIHGSGGYSPLLYKLSVGDAIGGFGGDIGGGYTYFFPSIDKIAGSGTIHRMQFGIYGGAGVAIYTAKAKLNDVTPSPAKGLIDSDGHIFDMHTTFSNYQEKQNMIFINIPVMAMYQIDQFYFLLGVKTSIPVISKYKTNDAILTNWGYYPEYENWAKTQNFAGFGDFDRNSKGDIKLGITAMLSFETYMKYIISRKYSLYYGLYFDYGLNNSLKEEKKFINYYPNNAENFTTNSVLSTSTESANIMAVGIKLRLAMSLW